MAHSMNPSVWVERRKTAGGDFKYRVRAEADGRRLPAGPWTPKRTWAEEEKAKVQARLWAGDRELVQRRRQMTWEGFQDYYLKHSQDTKAPRTYAQFDKPAVDAFTAWLKKHHGSPSPLSSITALLGSEWLIALKKAGYNETTRKMMFGAVFTALNHAVKIEVLTKNPWRALTKPTSEESGRALADVELEELFAAGPLRLWETGTFAVNCGPRISEICNRFNWTNVEVIVRRGQPAVSIAKALQELSGSRLQAAPWFGRILAQTRKSRKKVKKDCRFPINAEAKAAMGTPRPEGVIFPWSGNTIQHDVVAARVAAGLAEDITFHCFRHTFATRYLERGGHAEDLLETKLWSDYDALQRYIHVEDQVLERRFAASGRKFPPPSPQKQNGLGPA